MSRDHAESKSRVAVLARKLQEEIARRHLPEGAFFATEAQLCETHSVYRTIVREAVGRLRTLGILRAVQKKGLMVGGGNPLGAFTRAVPFYGRSSADNLNQLAELRYTLEVGAIELAVTNHTPEQLRRLAELAEAFAVADERGDVHEQCETDLQFHSVILEMTGNQMVAGMAKVLADFFHKADSMNVTAVRDPSTVADHRAIVEAIRERNIELLRVIMRQHVVTNLESASPGGNGAGGNGSGAAAG